MPPSSCLPKYQQSPSFITPLLYCAPPGRPWPSRPGCPSPPRPRDVSRVVPTLHGKSLPPVWEPGRYKRVTILQPGLLGLPPLLPPTSPALQSTDNSSLNTLVEVHLSHFLTVDHYDKFTYSLWNPAAGKSLLGHLGQQSKAT